MRLDVGRLNLMDSASQLNTGGRTGGPGLSYQDDRDAIRCPSTALQGPVPLKQEPGWVVPARAPVSLLKKEIPRLGLLKQKQNLYGTLVLGL